MTIRLIFDGKKAGRSLEHGLRIAQRRIAKTTTLTLQDAQREILQRGRADIRAGGDFGSRRWQLGLHADISQTQEVSTISTYHDVPYFRIFEYGGVIRGRPLLWIPLKFARDAKGVRARDYPGGLFRVDRLSGAPLLLSRRDRKPKYFGKESVTIPQKFHLRRIVIEVSRRLREFYSRNFRSEVGG